MAYAGEIAAILTAVCWSVNAILFADAGRIIGSRSVNHLRLWFALILLAGTHLLIIREPLPGALSPTFILLAVSGVIGFFMGDSLLFESYVRIGPRMGMLMMTAVPIFSVLLGRIFLNERLTIWQLSAITLTTVSIAFVTKDKRDNSTFEPGHLASGVLLGLGGAMGQAIGLMLSKRGLQGGINPVSANLIRVMAATAAISIFLLIHRRFFADFGKLRLSGVAPRVFGGALFGPVIGVVLSLVAILHAKLGVASTLMATSPVILIPLSRLIYKEYITARTVFWTVMAIVGAGWLFFL
ncbi:MAG: EamA family transporter [Candidatus Latescibacteria bacterium]|nr:EamA family transporter [bacterium]MBD3424430.1 EamA family transporter [Candidatus Latescibacterota bacterium]